MKLEIVSYPFYAKGGQEMVHFTSDGIRKEKLTADEVLAYLQKYLEETEIFSISTMGVSQFYHLVKK